MTVNEDEWEFAVESRFVVYSGFFKFSETLNVDITEVFLLQIRCCSILTVVWTGSDRFSRVIRNIIVLPI